jgi:ribosomal protein S18 acetylase RimI-like enzyme
MNPMNTTVDMIKIVEYHPDLAAGVAEMWNNSREGWGGHNSIKTAEQVRIEEENSTNIKLFLAMDGDKIVGYCSFGEYREDDGALYIPLLNVRTDYHGKKVGKKLVLKALEEAVKMNWPRLDLYTWPGNTKAVPLYKKCGFFWEDRDDSTHLMNFMPTVLNTELVQDFFEEVSWYDASTRVIEVKPDGRKENDYQYFQYSWENGNDHLTMEFEKSGRGLRLIETNGYSISATVLDFQPVFGNEYTIEYKIRNKTGKPLQVTLNGSDYKNIQFSLEKSIVVEDEVTFEALFYVGEIDEEQNDFRAHPVVLTNIEINGKKAALKVGVKPKFPAKVITRTPENLTYIGSSSQLFIDLTNNFNEEVTYSFILPENELLDFINPAISVKLAAKDSHSIAIPFTLKKHSFYNEMISIIATKSDGSTIVFDKKISASFKGLGAAFSGECDENYHIYNGQYQVWLSKFNNALIPGKLKTEQQKSYFMHPKLGKPYSEEFAKLKPESVEFATDAGTITMKASYLSRQQKGIKLHSITKLYSEGLVEYHYEVENTSNDETTEPVWLNVPVFHWLDRAVIPYKGKLVEMNDSIGAFHSNWDGENVTENWLFSRDNDNPRGLSWYKNDRIRFSNWFVFFEHSLGKIPAETTVKTNKIILSIGAFTEWEAFREFAQQQMVAQEPLTNHLEITLKNQNPVVSEKIEGVIRDYKSSYLDGEVALFIEGQHSPVHTEKLKAENEISDAHFTIDLPQNKKVGALRANLNLDSGSVERQTLFFKKGEGQPVREIKVEEGLEVHSIDNGELHLKAASGYSPGLFALEYKGENWLDNAFPTPQPKAWWNPWVGGFFNRLTSISPNSLLKEKSEVDFVAIKDNLDNKWEGFKNSVKIVEHKEYKGLELHQYYLVLPGLPVLCHFTEIHQNSNQYLMKNWETSCFFKVGAINQTWLQFQSQNGEWQKIFGGKSEIEMNVDRGLVIGSDNTDTKLQVIADLSKASLESYLNNEVIGLFIEETLNLSDKEVFFTAPTFFMFTDEVISDQALGDLKRIRFGKND